MSAVSPKVKAAALADLLNGDQPAIVAARYGIPGATVRKWKQRLVTDTVTENDAQSVTVSVTTRPAVVAQQMEMSDLVLENLRAKLIATKKIAEYVTTKEWLSKQNAADVAQLFEVIDRAAVAILDRMAHRGRAADTDADDRGSS